MEFHEEKEDKQYDEQYCLRKDLHISIEQPTEHFYDKKWHGHHNRQHDRGRQQKTNTQYGIITSTCVFDGFPMTSLAELYPLLMNAYVAAGQSDDDNDREHHQERIEDLWGVVEHHISHLSSNISAGEQNILEALFSLAINPDDFTQAQLWNFDEPIMKAALCIHQVLPHQHTQAEHISCLINFFWAAANSSSSRATLIGAILDGPKHHWVDGRWEDTLRLYSEMIYTLYRQDNQFQGESIGVVSQYLNTLGGMAKQPGHLQKTSRRMLYQVVHDLIQDELISLYADILPHLDGHKVVKTCLASQRSKVDDLDKLDKVVSDAQLQAWFPGQDQRTRQLAQKYPRLQAMLDKRLLRRELRDTLPHNQRKLKM